MPIERTFVEPGVLIRELQLADGTLCESESSFEQFAEMIYELQEEYPSYRFQFVPYAFRPTRHGSGLKSMLAIGRIKD